MSVIRLTISDRRLKAFCLSQDPQGLAHLSRDLQAIEGLHLIIDVSHTHALSIQAYDLILQGTSQTTLMLFNYDRFKLAVRIPGDTKIDRSTTGPNPLPCVTVPKIGSLLILPIILGVTKLISQLLLQRLLKHIPYLRYESILNAFSHPSNCFLLKIFSPVLS